ncbi:hypothetical protein TWF696_002627 [Orbilia brochopaga]|uniref:Uncharacterized protein n=1 Tax=Orbilia brochopaga TaxID=3140254 RepID=A0AAV9U4W7_9PEZI
MRLRQNGGFATGLLALLLQTNPVIGITKRVTFGFLNNFRNDHRVTIGNIQNVLDRISDEAYYNKPIGFIEDHQEEQLEAIENGRRFEAGELGVPLEDIPMPEFYTDLNSAFESLMYKLIEAVEEVDYTTLSFQPEAQRIAEGFNLRLLNEDARRETIQALDELLDLNDNIYLSGEWDIRVASDFFNSAQELREDDDLEEQPFIHVLDNLVFVLANTWIVPPTWLSVVAYLWNAVPEGDVRGQMVWRINPDGPQQLADGLAPLYEQLYSYRNRFQQAMRRAFKFLPRELPIITDTYRKGVAIVEFFTFYERLIDDFYAAVSSVVPPPLDELEYPH